MHNYFSLANEKGSRKLGMSVTFAYLNFSVCLARRLKFTQLIPGGKLFLYSIQATGIV